jgi:hypothetical protein
MPDAKKRIRIIMINSDQLIFIIFLDVYEMKFSDLSEAQISCESSHRPIDGGSVICPGMPDYGHYTQLLTEEKRSDNSKSKDFPMRLRVGPSLSENKQSYLRNNSEFIYFPHYGTKFTTSIRS